MARGDAHSRSGGTRGLRHGSQSPGARRYGRRAPHRAFAEVEPAMTTRATTFYYSFLALPAVKRDAVIAVWDFCRAVDDAVDEPEAADPAGELSRWREEVS